MYRNWQLIREILLFIEPLAYPNEYVGIQLDERTTMEISYHISLLREGGLIEAEDVQFSCFVEWHNLRLTWAGHEFLDLARDPQIWENTLAQLQKLSSASFILFSRLLQEQAQQAYQGTQS